MTRAWWTRLQPADPAGAVPDRLLARRHGTGVPAAVAPVLRASPAPVRLRSRLGLMPGCSSGRTCWGCRPPSFSSSPSDTKPPAPGPEPFPGAWSKLSDTPCAWSASSSPTSCSSASPAPLEIISLFTRRWIPPAVGTLLSTAVRFLPLTLTEARRIYDIQRCRGLRLRPWAPRSCLPVIVPLFVSQMCRAHDTSVMLVVRRIATVTRGASLWTFGLADLVLLGLALASCLPILL